MEFLPPTGYGWINQLFVCNNNLTAAKQIKAAKMIGDDIKRKIIESWSEDQIKKYLNELYT